MSDSVDLVVEADVARGLDDDAVEALADDDEVRELADRSQLDGEAIPLGDEAEGFGDVDDGPSAMGLRGAAEIGAGFGAFQGDVADDLGGVLGMRLDEVLRSGSAVVAIGIDAVIVGTGAGA